MINKIFIGTKKHRIALVFVLVVFLILSFPHIASFLNVKPYNGAPFLFQNDEDVYLSRIREIYDGNLTVGSPMFLEYKNSVSALFPIGEYVYLIPTIVGIPFIFSVIMVKILLPCVLFFLVYFLIYSIIKDGNIDKSVFLKLSAIAGGLLVVFGSELVNIRNFISLFAYSGSFLDLPVWMRLVNPITGGVFLFCFLIVLWKIFKGNDSLILSVSGGLVLVLMSGYFFSFALSFIILFLVFISSLYLKKNTTVKNCVIVGFLGILPFLLQVYLTFYNNLNKLSPSRNGLFFTHMAMPNTFVIVAVIFLCLITIFLKYKKQPISDRFYFLWILVLGSFIAFNQQIITGRAIWPAHFVQYSIPLVFVASIIFFYFLVFPRWRKIYQIGIIAIIVISLMLGFCSMYSYKMKSDDYKKLNDVMPIFSWLNKNASHPCVVLSAEPELYFPSKIPGYTRCEDYYSTYVFFGVPPERILHNYFIILRLRGITSSDIDLYLENHAMEVRANFFRDWKDLFSYRKAENQDPWLLSISNMEEINNWYDNLSEYLSLQYKIFLQGDFEKKLEKYRLDYVLWDSNRFSSFDPQKLKFLKQVYSYNGIYLYEIH